jgi:hypothetical protein
MTMHTIRRRKLLKLSALGAVGVAAAVCAQGCALPAWAIRCGTQSAPSPRENTG